MVGYFIVVKAVDGRLVMGVKGVEPLFVSIATVFRPFIMTGVDGADDDIMLLLTPSCSENGHTVLRRCMGVGAPIMLFHASGWNAKVRRPFMGVEGPEIIILDAFIISCCC